MSIHIKLSRRFFSLSSLRSIKVTIAGAAGGVGQPLSLLLKQCNSIKTLSLYDIANLKGVAADLSHIETRPEIEGYEGPSQLSDAFKSADIIVIAAGAPRKPGMSRGDLFNTNAPIVGDLVAVAAKAAPHAFFAVITNPVNSIVPLVCETINKFGKLDSRKVFGVTLLDNVRATTFVAKTKLQDPLDVKIPVIGGHSETTMVPLLSQITPTAAFSSNEIETLTNRIRNAGAEVAKAKDGRGTATLSMAYSGAKFVMTLIKAIQGEENVIESAYVKSNVTEAKYFANPLVLGRNGVEKNLGYTWMSSYEARLLRYAVMELQKDIQIGEDFANRGSAEITT